MEQDLSSPAQAELKATVTVLDMAERLGLASRNASEATRTADMLLAANALRLFPGDLGILHHVGALRKCHGDDVGALADFHAALSIRPGFRYTQLEVAEIYSNLGRADQARECYEAALRSAPAYATGYLLAARFERRQGRRFAELLHLQAAFALEPDNRIIVEELLEVLLFHGQGAQARALMERLLAAYPEDREIQDRLLLYTARLGRHADVLALCDRFGPGRTGPAAHNVAVYSGHAKLAQAYDLDHTVMRMAAHERSVRWRNTTDVAGMLREAIAQARPFSLIRLGDGEARFLLRDAADLPATMAQEERDAIGDVMWFNWFGAVLPDDMRTRTASLREQFVKAMTSADLLGVPAASRLAIDWMHIGYLSYLASKLESLLADMPGLLLTDAFIQIQLCQRSAFLGDFLRGLPWLGTISPHAELGARLRTHLGIAAGEDYLIPGEMRLPSDGPMVRGTGHFPERFDALMESLRLPRRGAVVLVAGGLLGKIYCARIKELGGIAIDIGSLADAWMGYRTRPGQYQPPEKWQLPR